MQKPCMVNWNNFRSENSMEKSFEDLCCQVANLKKPSSGIEFIANGDPDGGVDCYWILKDSNIHGWQAKFFRGYLTSSRWTQINDSVKDAIQNYPKLTEYTVCMPMNLPNSGENSARKKWEECKKEWLKLKPNVTYNFFGHNEFVKLLSDYRYVGKLKYFFGSIAFTQSWLNDQKKVIRQTIGLRYSEEVNVDLPLIKQFDALCKSEKFIDELHTYIDKLNHIFNRIHNLSIVLNLDFQMYNIQIKNLIDRLSSINERTDQDIEIDDLIQNCSSLFDELRLYNERINFYDMSNSLNPLTHGYDVNSKKLHEIQAEFMYDRSLLQKYLFDLQTFLKERICIDTRQLIVTGNAGMGKTHLFFDILQKRLENNQTTILLLGQRFETNPLNEIPEQLGFDCNIDEFLGALDSHAEATGHRSLLLIDALNESPNENIWENYLKQLSEIISKYKSISFAVSARSGYVKKYADIIPNRCMHVEHHGFQDNPKKYVDIFFRKNNLKIPNMPFLQREFSSPQFLFLLCKAMEEKQIEDISSYSLDILSVYELYIKTINEKLCMPNKLDYDQHSNIAGKGIEELVKLMASKSILELNYDIAYKCLLNVYPSTRDSKSLLYNLIQEGILLKDYSTNKIQFVFERLAEHLIVREYLNEYDHNTIVKAFHKGGKLFRFFDGDDFYYKHSGIIDAILIQLPDKFCKEIVEIIPNIMDNPVMITAVFDSLSLRKPNNISIKTIESFQKIIRTREDVDHYFKTLLILAIKSNSNINADYLHVKLLNMKMVDRDKLWSIFLHNHYINNGIVMEYITWAQNITHNTNSKEQLFLSATIMCWFLTSSDKIIRDNTVMALIELMCDNAEQWLSILKRFENCNDPYVIANLYAVTYSIILTNTSNKPQIEKIATYIYSKTFAEDKPPCSILIRDYARRIINYVNTIIPNLPATMSNIDPPYTNTILKLPAINKLKLLIDELPKHEFNNHNMQDRGLIATNSSLSDRSDFFRYVLGSNTNAFQWYGIKLNDYKKNNHLEFDVYSLRNWISNKIIQIGWKKEYFGEFDSYVHKSNVNRFDEKYERIGKKYQWLAYYELLSKISDEYKFKSNSNDIYQKYLGTWQLSGLQTTDPTWIRKKNKNDDLEMISKEWFPNTQCDLDITDITKWLKNETNVPDIHKILQTKNSDESEWITLFGTYIRKYMMKKDNPNIIRSLILTSNSYLCHKNDTEKILKYFHNTGNTIKRFNLSHNVFLGELYWHESVCKSDDVDWFQHDDRSQIMPSKLYSTTYGLTQESILTHNLNSNMKILFPNKLLYEKMNLINNMNGRCSDLNKNIVTFNTMFDNDQQFLLINKKKFLNFLTKNNYDVIWQIWGEKRMDSNESKFVQPYIWTDLDGLYTLKSDKISGKLSHMFKRA